MTETTSKTRVAVTVDGRGLDFATAADATACYDDLVHYGVVCVARDDDGKFRRLEPRRHRDFGHATFRNTATV